MAKKLLKKLTNKYRLIIYNDNSFEEVFSFRLSRFNVFMFFGIMSVIIMSLIYLLIALTPLKAYVIPDFPKAEERQKIINNALLVDSLQRKLKMYEQYSKTIQTILSGVGPSNFPIEEPQDTTKKYNNLNFAPSKEDSLLRKQIEEEEQYNLTLFNEEPATNSISDLYFFPPVTGLITNQFNAAEKHFAIDIVGLKDNVIHSVMDGKIIFSDWSIGSGYVIMIQHENNLISVYKHLSKVFNKVGDHVVVGEQIGIMGNTGEITTGPHLHLELWLDGTPLNPEDYIVFQ